MGDHRATIKISLTLPNKVYEEEMWINYSPYDCCRMDERVIKFFSDAWNEHIQWYEDGILKSRRKEEEKKERELYERLKNKYENK